MKTDAELKKDVIAELDWAPSVDASQIGVEVLDGIVTLVGRVSSFSQKWDAEAAVQHVVGVKALAVEVDVVLPGDCRRNDSDIARTVVNVLDWTTCLPRNAVSVMVENGWVGLRGEVEWAYQRQAAVQAVRHLMGVVGVSDAIMIKPGVSPGLVKADIRAAMRRRASFDAENIVIHVDGAEVTLSGTAASWAERQLANTCAWSTPGVENVIDKMLIARLSLVA
jgi:osmotically-inducible protein OsmY